MTDLDWDFNAVADHEIIPCCLWEYARESTSIGLAADMYWREVGSRDSRQKHELEPETNAAAGKKADRIQRRAKAAGFDYEGFLNRFWSSDLAACEIYQTIREQVTDGTRAWQTLSAEFRGHLVKQAAESLFLHPVQPSMIGDLEKLWNVNRGHLDEIRSKPRAENDDSEECAAFESSTPVTLGAEPREGASGTVAAAFTVDFARFSDREIVAEFQAWLAAHRPKCWHRPLRIFPGSAARGKKHVEYRVALERLGLMRLLHWHTPTEIRSVWPKAWKKYRTKQGSFRREVRQSSRFFHKLFPFVPQNEHPASEERFGVWTSRANAVCDRTDREMGLS